jgi:hypothetical protein
VAHSKGLGVGSSGLMDLGYQARVNRLASPMLPEAIRDLHPCARRPKYPIVGWRSGWKFDRATDSTASTDKETTESDLR